MSQLKILLLEGIHQQAVDNLQKNNFIIDRESSAYSEKELLEKLDTYDAVGIRSKTQLTSSVLSQCTNLKAIGCFCIGTNQVDLQTAQTYGLPVFNAPYSNTRSVAELVISLMVSLSRQICDRSEKAHRGVWDKSAIGSNEVRGKTLGIIGYGHIGAQLSILAEALGLNVQYFDVVKKLPMGNASSTDSMGELLASSDFVSLHVPETEQTKNLFTAKELGQMKKGSYLINASRGSVVDIKALAQALKDKHISGAAIDVYPKEPKNNKEQFTSELQGLPNVILTPHIGGSTEEAQLNIGLEVSTSLADYLTKGQTWGAVNFPQIDLPRFDTEHFRLINIHKNEPGSLGAINSIVSKFGANIMRQYLSTKDEIGYLIMDLQTDQSEQILKDIRALKSSVRTRFLQQDK